MRIHEIDVFDTSHSAGAIIWALAWPAIVEQILQVMVNYVDSAMVGSLGAEATASISINSSLIWLVNGLMNAIAIGFSVLMARHLGAGHKNDAQNVVRQAIVCQLLFGIGATIVMFSFAPFFPRWLGGDKEIWGSATSYMKGIAIGYIPSMLMIGESAMIRLSGDTKTPLLLNACNNIINIVLNFFFIFPELSIFGLTIPSLGMGVAGAAIATSISATITALLLTLSLQQKGRNIRLEKHASWKIDKRVQKSALLLALPVAMERVTLNLGQIVLTRMVSVLGITALAAHYLANTAEQFTFLPPTGFATAATTLVAQTLGADKEEMAKKYADKCLLWGTVLVSCMGAIMYILAPSLIGMFTRETAVVILGATVLRIEAFGDPGFGLSQLVFGVLRGSGDTKLPFLVSLLGMWLIRLPLAAILLKTTNLGLASIWIAMMTDMVIRGIVSLLFYLKGTWLSGWKKQR
mgnify:CR=1 FL=1|jgi:putative MATE family efflux protein